MASHVALLRGINVGGKHMLPMAKVKAAFEACGATAVATYIQSGNVVFRHAGRSAQLTSQLAEALQKVAGFAVPVVLRTATEWSAVIAANPYVTDTVHCAFLPVASTKVALAKLAAIDAAACLPSRFAVAKREIYFDLPEGIGRAKLAATVLRTVPDATTRNWRTVVQLSEMLAALP